MATVELTHDNFEQIVLTGDNVVIIDFWAEWCGPCKSFAPTFEEASELYPNLIFAKVDVDAQQELAGTFQIRSIPTLMIFKESIAIFQESGVLPLSALRDLIDQAILVDMTEVRQQLEQESHGH